MMVRRAGCSYNDRYVQNHVRDLAGFRGPGRVDQLTYGCTQWIGQGRDSGGTDAATIRKPQIAVPRRRAQAEGLGETSQDLPKHGESENPSLGFGAGISNPVSEQEQNGCREDGGLRAAFVEGVDNDAV